jgi:hypothetical protein
MKSIRLMKPGKITTNTIDRSQFVNELLKSSEPLVSHMVLSSIHTKSGVEHTFLPMVWKEHWNISQQGVN